MRPNNNDSTTSELEQREKKSKKRERGVFSGPSTPETSHTFPASGRGKDTQKEPVDDERVFFPGRVDVTRNNLSRDAFIEDNLLAMLEVLKVPDSLNTPTLNAPAVKALEALWNMGIESLEPLEVAEFTRRSYDEGNAFGPFLDVTYICSLKKFRGFLTEARTNADHLGWKEDQKEKQRIEGNEFRRRVAEFLSSFMPRIKQVEQDKWGLVTPSQRHELTLVVLNNIQGRNFDPDGPPADAAAVDACLTAIEQSVAALHEEGRAAFHAAMEADHKRALAEFDTLIEETVAAGEIPMREFRRAVARLRNNMNEEHFVERIEAHRVAREAGLEF
jgi:hypothetical protein